MAQKRPREALPGNDGRWFLELVGALPPEPSPTDTYATLQQLIPPPPSDETATIASTAVATTASGGLETSASPNGGPPGDDMERARGFAGWWVLASVLLLLGIAVAAGVVLLPRAAQTEAAAAAAAHRSALVALHNELPATQRALDDLTDPTSSVELVATIPAALARLSTATGEVTAVATGRLPATLPLVPRDRFDALEPARSAMLILSGEAAGLGAQLGTGYAYRTAIGSLFAIGPLPVTLDDEATAELSLTLATDLADTGRIVAELRAEPRFRAVYDLAAAVSERYATWQLDYLDALYEDDPARAESLVAELAATVDGMNAALEEALLTLRTDADAEIVRLASELETAIEAVP